MNESTEDIKDVKLEIAKLSKSIISLSDIISNNLKNNNKKTYTNEERIHARLVESQKQEAEKLKELYRSKEKTPEELKQEQLVGEQLKANNYLSQLTKMIKENSLTEQKQLHNRDTENEKYKIPTKIKRGMSESSQSFARGEDMINNFSSGFSNLFSGIGSLKSDLKKKFSFFNIKKNDFLGTLGIGASGKSKERQSDLEQKKAEINQNKVLLSAHETELQELKKKRGKNRDLDAIESMQKIVDEDKKAITQIAESIASLSSEEYLYQKGKKDSFYKNLAGQDKNLVLKQMKNNMTSELIKDIYPQNKTKKPIEQYYTERVPNQKLTNKLAGNTISGNTISNSQYKNIAKTLIAIKNNEADVSKKLGILNKSIGSYTKKTSNEGDVSKKLGALNKSIGSYTKKLLNADTKISVSSNPKTYGEYVAGIYNELHKMSTSFNDINKMLKTISDNQQDNNEDGGGGGLGAILGLAGGLFGNTLLKTGLKKLVTKFAGKELSKEAVKVGGKNVAKSVAKTGSKKAAETLAKKTASTVGKEVVKKTAGKALGKGIAKSALKAIPGIGLLAGLAFGAQRAMSGDWAGAGLELASGLAGTIPVVGTAASIALDAGIVGRDVYKATTDSDDNTGSDLNEKINSSSDYSSKLLHKSNVPQPTQSSILNRRNMGNSNSSVVEGAKPVIESNQTGTFQLSPIDRLTEMNIQAKLIASEIYKIQKNPDYVNQQKAYMKEAGAGMATSLMGGE